MDQYGGYSDNISEMSHVKKVEEVQSRAFGQAAMNMYNNADSNQQDDFFWKGHQQRKGPKYEEPAEQLEQPEVKTVVQSSPVEMSSATGVVDKKALINELKAVDLEISQLIDEIDNNFSLSKRDIQIKRKELHKIQSRRNQINSMLAE